MFRSGYNPGWQYDCLAGAGFSCPCGVADSGGVAGCRTVFQKAHAIRRNFPLIGRFRYFFEHLGEFFRQYFAMDKTAIQPGTTQLGVPAAKKISNTCIRVDQIGAGG